MEQGWNSARLTTKLNGYQTFAGLTARRTVTGRGKAREHCCLTALSRLRMYLAYIIRTGWRNALSTAVMGHCRRSPLSRPLFLPSLSLTSRRSLVIIDTTVAG